jgi:hypothetical protein
MARDEELPPVFARLNQFGVPSFSLLIMTVIPTILVLLVSDISGLADLYAVGVVGAIATNLGATSTDGKLSLLKRERVMMFLTFLILLAIECSLFVDKPNARVFAVTILAIGLILRGLAHEYAMRKSAKIKELGVQPAVALSPAIPVSPSTPIPSRSSSTIIPSTQHHGGPILTAVRGLGKTLDFAVSEARESGRPLYVMFVREQPIIAPGDRKRKWQEDDEAREIFNSLKGDGGGELCENIIPCYAISDSPADTIADLASTVGAERVIIGAPQRGTLITMLRGDMVTKLSKLIPEEMYLVVCA